MTENLERPQVYGEYPPPFSVIQKERKLTFKRETLAKLELISRKWSSEEVVVEQKELHSILEFQIGIIGVLAKMNVERNGLINGYLI